MDTNDAADAVRRYYAAYRSDHLRVALADVLARGFTLDSPLVRDRVGGPASGEVAIMIAEQFASVLRHAEVEALYFTTDNAGVAALIRIPGPHAPVWQSEHFDLDVGSGRITALRSFYDPRALTDPNTAVRRQRAGPN